MNINEAIADIKRVGATNARVVPAEGQDHTGRHQIEVREGGTWRVLEATKGLSRQMADDLVKQATNRVLLG